MKKKKQPNDRRHFLKKSVEAMIVTPAIATSIRAHATLRLTEASAIKDHL
jgi:hypothetical protein